MDIFKQSDSDEEALFVDDASYDGEEASPCYNCAEEENPLHPAYHDSIGEIKDQAIAVVAPLVKMLAPLASKSAVISKLLEKVQSIQHMPSLARPVLVLVGEAGAGKSSTVNSVLHIPNIAKTSSAGMSCTAAATEYSGPFPYQAKRFAAKVHYFSFEDIKSLMDEHIKNFEYYVTTEDRDWANDDEKEQARLAAKTCIDVLFALCSKWEGFDSPDAVKASLRQNIENPDMNLPGEIVYICDELLARKRTDLGECFDLVEEDEAERLQQILTPFVSTFRPSSRNQEHPPLWPLVKKVCIGIRESRILDHIVIVDLPGISDTNQVRVKVAQEYLRKCDALWIVTTIHRVVTDRTVDRLLDRYAKRFAGMVAVVCTGSEDKIYNDMEELAKDFQALGLHLGNYRRLTRESQQLGREIRILEKRVMRKSRAQTKATLSAEVEGIQMRLIEYRTRLDDIDTERYTGLFDVRINNVERKLREGKTIDFGIFCISNVQYATLNHPGGHHRLPQLSAKDTGIPALRAHALLLPASQIWENLKHHIGHNYSAALNQLALWSKSQLVDRRAGLATIVGKPAKIVARYVAELRKSLKSLTEEMIRQPLDTERQAAISEALNTLKRYDAWHWQTIKAFTRKFGKSSTSVKPAQSWNEEFTRSTTMHLDTVWDVVDARKSELIADVLARFTASLEEVPQEIENKPQLFSLDMTNVIGLVQAHVAAVTRASLKLRSDLKGRSIITYNDATQDRYTGYFLPTIETAYVATNDDRGTGFKRRWYARFLDHLSRRGRYSPFAILTDKIMKCTDRDHDECVSTFEKSVMQDLREMEDGFNLLCDNSKILGHEEERLRRDVAEYMLTAILDLEDIVAQFPKIEAEVEARKARKAGLWFP